MSDTYTENSSQKTEAPPIHLPLPGPAASGVAAKAGVGGGAGGMKKEVEGACRVGLSAGMYLDKK